MLTAAKNLFSSLLLEAQGEKLVFKMFLKILKTLVEKENYKLAPLKLEGIRNHLAV